MTDTAYYAQRWLRRTDELERSRILAYNKAVELMNKANHCTMNFERSGADPYLKQSRHEDLLCDYADACEKLRYITLQCSLLDLETIHKLDAMDNNMYAALLIDRYINRYSWDKICKLKKYQVSRSTLYEMHRKALEVLGLKMAVSVV